jgi:hypothetical protein
MPSAWRWVRVMSLADDRASCMIQKGGDRERGGLTQGRPYKGCTILRVLGAVATGEERFLFRISTDRGSKEG